MNSCKIRIPNDRLCPSCMAQLGALRDLEVGKGLVLLSLECRACRHVWMAHRGMRVPNWRAQAAAYARK
jgi:rubredoxin